MFGSKWYWVSNGFSSTSGVSTSTHAAGHHSSNGKSKAGISYTGSGDKKSTTTYTSSADSHVSEKDWPQEAHDRIQKLEKKIKKLKKKLNSVKVVEPDEL